MGAEELEKIIEDANKAQELGEAENYFTEYLGTLEAPKRYRFFEKIGRSGESLKAVQARALAIAVALGANKLEYDELDIGEFPLAANVALTLAYRFKDTHEIMDVLRDIITRSTTDGFAYRIFEFVVISRDRNKIFEQWENVDTEDLESVFLKRLKGKYHKGGDQSIYSPRTNWRDWQTLVWWSRRSDKDAEDVRAYLEDEFERRPASIGKHIHWLWSTAGSADGKKLVDRLFPLRKLADLAKVRGKTAYSTEFERKTVQALIDGDWSNTITG